MHFHLAQNTSNRTQYLDVMNQLSPALNRNTLLLKGSLAHHALGMSQKHNAETKLQILTRRYFVGRMILVRNLYRKRVTVNDSKIG